MKILPFNIKSDRQPLQGMRPEDIRRLVFEPPRPHAFELSTDDIGNFRRTQVCLLQMVKRGKLLARTQKLNNGGMRVWIEDLK